MKSVPPRFHCVQGSDRHALSDNRSDCQAKLAGFAQSNGAAAFPLPSRDRAETARSLPNVCLTATFSPSANTVTTAGDPSLQPDGIRVGGAARLLAHPLKGA